MDRHGVFAGIENWRASAQQRADLSRVAATLWTIPDRGACHGIRGLDAADACDAEYSAGRKRGVARAGAPKSTGRICGYVGSNAIFSGSRDRFCDDDKAGFAWIAGGAVWRDCGGDPDVCANLVKVVLAAGRGALGRR